MKIDDIIEHYDYSLNFSNLTRRLKKNKMLSNLYFQFAQDLEFDDLPEVVENSSYFNLGAWKRSKDSLINRSERVASCCNYWEGDYYPFQAIKDLRKTYMCGDRFCDNCQNAFSFQRAQKYEPLLLKLSEDYDIYHVILTVPNVYLDKLSVTLDRMFKSYKYLCRYLDGRSKISCVDFFQLGYYGSIRALEITKNKKDNTFHPHFHCLWICKMGAKILNNRTEVNVYSFKNYNSHIPKNYHKDEPRMFSNFEILIQKVWRLLYDGKKVTFDNLCALSLGYSCQMINAKGNYKEVFKYATKGLLSSDSNKSPVDGSADFDLLFVSLYRRRLIQGYGCLYRLNFDDSVDFSSDDEYLDVIRYLHELENPLYFLESKETVADNMEKARENKTNIKYISRKNLRALVENET